MIIGKGNPVFSKRILIFLGYFMSESGRDFAEIKERVTPTIKNLNMKTPPEVVTFSFLIGLLRYHLERT